MPGCTDCTLARRASARARRGRARARGLIKDCGERQARGSQRHAGQRRDPTREQATRMRRAVAGMGGRGGGAHAGVRRLVLLTAFSRTRRWRVVAARSASRVA